MSCELKNVKKGDNFSRISFGKVVEVTTEGVTVENEKGNSWGIGKDIFEDEFNIASSYTNVEKLPKMELSQLILNNPRIVMTIGYNKKLDEKTEKKKLVEAIIKEYPNAGKLKSKKEYDINISKLIKDFSLEGEEREIQGRHYGTFDKSNTYLQFIDMEEEKDESKNYDTRGRLVNLRSVNYVIVDGIKYTRK